MEGTDDRSSALFDDDVRRAQLLVRGGVGDLALRALASGAASAGDGPYREGGAPPALLYDARFAGRAPEVEARSDLVVLRYRRGPLFGWLDWEERAADVALQRSVAWRVDVRAGMHRLEAELEGLDVEEIRVTGGMHDARLRLPAPSGIARVEVRGGAHRLSIEHPEGVPIRLRLRGGVHSIAIDRLELGGGVASLDWQSPEFAGASRGYDIELVGGVHQATISAVAARAPAVVPEGSSAAAAR
jgi:hypothetical protein